MKTILVKCSQCAKEFLKPYSEVKRMETRNWHNHFCDVNCLSLFGIISKEKKTQEKIIEYDKNPKRCLNCNNPIEYGNKSWKKYCSSKCAATHNQKTGGHRIWGEDEKWKQKRIAKENLNFCGWNKGMHYAPTEVLKCSVCKKEFVQIISKKTSNKTNTCSRECLRKIQSINLIEQYKNGKEVYGGTTKWLKYKDIKVQGSYEYRTCVILDKWLEQSKIQNWEYTKDRFEYVGIDDKKHHYLMDFKVWKTDNTFYYLETKGYEKENDKLKWKAVRESGHNLTIWFNEDIKREENLFRSVA